MQTKGLISTLSWNKEHRSKVKVQTIQITRVVELADLVTAHLCWDCILKVLDRFLFFISDQINIYVSFFFKSNKYIYLLSLELLKI